MGRLECLVSELQSLEEKHILAGNICWEPEARDSHIQGKFYILSQEEAFGRGSLK